MTHRKWDHVKSTTKSIVPDPNRIRSVIFFVAQAMKLTNSSSTLNWDSAHFRKRLKTTLAHWKRQPLERTQSKAVHISVNMQKQIASQLLNSINHYNGTMLSVTVMLIKTFSDQKWSYQGNLQNGSINTVQLAADLSDIKGLGMGQYC